MTGIEVISDPGLVRERLDELSFFARGSICALQPRTGMPAKRAARRPDERSLRRSLPIRLVVESGHAGNYGNLTVRSSPRPLPHRLVIIDETIAVTSRTGSTGHGAVVVREPALVLGLRRLFETTWAACAPPPMDLPTAAERRLLDLLLTCGTDESIARSLGISARQVRRRTAQLLRRLEVLTRFAAGAEAARRGWL